jgi:hypothetical protein
MEIPGYIGSSTVRSQKSWIIDAILKDVMHLFHYALSSIGKDIPTLYHYTLKTGDKKTPWNPGDVSDERANQTVFG